MKEIRNTQAVSRIISNLLKGAYLVLAILVIGFAVLVTIARLATPYVNKALPQIESYFSKQLGKPVHIGKIDMWWNAFGPTVKLENLTIDRQLQIKSLDVDLNLFKTIYNRQVVINDIVIMGGGYSIVQLPNHGWSVNHVQFFQNTDKKPILLDTLFSFSDIAVRNVHIVYLDLQQRNVEMDIAYLHLHNREGRHSLSGFLNLLDPYRIPFHFNLNLTGDISDLDKIQATLYLKTSDILLSHVLPQKIIYNQMVRSGFGDGELWIHWQHSKIQKVQAQMNVTDLQLSTDERTLMIPRFSANLAWVRETTGWLFSADHIVLDFDRHNWPVSSAYVEKQITGIRMGVSYISLSDVRRLLSHFSLLPPRQLQELSAFNPTGEISNMILAYSGKGWSPQQVSFSGDFKNISLATQTVIPAIPSVTNLSGQVFWQQDHGNIFVNSNQLNYTDHRFFGKTMLFQQVYLDLNVQELAPDVFSIAINNAYINSRDVQAGLQGSLALDLKRNRSNLSLLSALRVSQSAHLYQYLPVHVMDSQFKGWTSQAFQTGTITATTLFKGPLNDFPFSHSTGILLSNMAASQVKLRYSPKWPVLTIPSMTATIVNDRLTMSAPKAFSRKVTADNVSAIIPAMTQDNPSLALSFTSSNNLSAMRDLIDHSSLSDSLGQSLDNLYATGLVKLNLQLNIPFDHVDDTMVNGQLNLQDGSLSTLGLSRNVREINGDIKFTQAGLTVTHATAVVFNHPAMIAAETIHTYSGLDILNIHVHTAVDAAYLQSISKLPIKSVINGVIPFDACIIRTLNAKHDNGGITLQVKSNLEGVTLTLPGDLMKPAPVKRDFKLQLDYFNQHFSNVKMAYADLLSVDVDTIGTSNADQSASEGFSVNLALKQFDWPVWQAYFLKQRSSQLQQALPVSQGQPLLRMSKDYHNKIVNINAQIGQASLYHQVLNNVVLVLQPQNNAWDFHITSDHVTGDFVLPLGKGPIIGTFSHFYLQPIPLPKQAAGKQTRAGPSVDLSQIPPLKLSIQDFSYAGKLTGKLLLDLSKLHNGIRFNKMEFTSSLLTAKLTGQWLQQNQIEKTSLAGTLSSTNISEFLKTLNMDEDKNFNLSTGQFVFDLQWPGPPYKPALKSMVGDADLSLGAGNIVDIGKNAENQLNFGRLLNALSLQSILQKLTMNFNDYKEGYDFTSMEGKFTLSQGDLYTPQTQLNGPVASVKFSGHTDVVKHSFNILLSITPHVTGSVPVVAALLINPAVGVAAWVANLFVSPAVGQAVAQQFQLTGTWDNPKIAPLANNTNTSQTHKAS